MNKIRNECSRGTAQHECFGDKVKRAKAEMVCPRAEGERILKMELPVRRQR